MSVYFFPPSSRPNEQFPLFQATLAILDKLDIDSEKPNEEEVARMFGYEEEYLAGTLTPWQRTKPKLWALFNEPHSSLSAKVSAIKRISNICAL
jgi:potassium voltage-gated channel Shaw-related subfamily C protein